MMRNNSLFSFIMLLLQLIWLADSTLDNEYPETIPVVKVRIDQYTKKPVTSGLVHTLKNSTLKEFKKHLQCAPTEPDFDYNSGAISMLRAMPPTRETLMLMCSYGESKCDPWSNCRANMVAYKMNNETLAKPFRGFSFFQQFKLFRVIKGKLFLDWPWGVNRFLHKEGKEINEIVPLMRLVLEKITDMKDSAFFVGCENPALPYNFPFPIFSSATNVEFADIPWPWYEALKSARVMYKSVLDNKGNFTEASFVAVTRGYLPWEKKQAKAAFRGSWDANRMIMMDHGSRNKDVFDVAYGFPYQACLPAYNPLSKERCIDTAMFNNMSREEREKGLSLPFGYNVPLLNVSDGTNYAPGTFKYVIVPLGGGAKTTSGRLAYLLAFSGAVIMIQRTHHVYHFSARLKPWVHYVPLTYSGADVVEKVRWLVAHDSMARQIAENGRAFARSYLRLEDYYCYGAAALEVIADIEEKTDVTVPFDPQPMGELTHLVEHVSV